MARHHFVPQHPLRRSARSGKFVAYYFEATAGRVIENPKAVVASACQIADLNAYWSCGQPIETSWRRTSSRQLSIRPLRELWIRLADRADCGVFRIGKSQDKGQDKPDLENPYR
jgi:hypothetical protein